MAFRLTTASKPSVVVGPCASRGVPRPSESCTADRHRVLHRARGQDFVPDAQAGGGIDRYAADRWTAFHAAVRTLFTEIASINGGLTGNRLIDFVDEVTGIWGVRTGNSEGRDQFRVSLNWRSRLVSVLKQSRNLPSAKGAHVLMPVATTIRCSHHSMCGQAATPGHTVRPLPLPSYRSVTCVVMSPSGRSTSIFTGVSLATSCPATQTLPPVPSMAIFILKILALASSSSPRP